MNISQRIAFESGTQQLLDNQPERLFISGLRCIMAGYDYADIGCWETAWTIYTSEVDVTRARALLGEMQYFVRALRSCGPGPLSLFPHSCRRLSHDESLVLNLVVCLQQNDEKAARSAADRLTGAILKDRSVSRTDAIVAACRDVANLFESQGAIFVPLGQEVLDQLTGRSNEMCIQCPATGSLVIPDISRKAAASQGRHA